MLIRPDPDHITALINVPLNRRTHSRDSPPVPQQTDVPSALRQTYSPTEPILDQDRRSLERNVTSHPPVDVSRKNTEQEGLSLRLQIKADLTEDSVPPPPDISVAGHIAAGTVYVNPNLYTDRGLQDGGRSGTITDQLMSVANAVGQYRTSVEPDRPVHAPGFQVPSSSGNFSLQPPVTGLALSSGNTSQSAKGYGDIQSQTSFSDQQMPPGGYHPAQATKNSAGYPPAMPLNVPLTSYTTSTTSYTTRAAPTAAVTSSHILSVAGSRSAFSAEQVRNGNFFSRTMI